MDWTGYRARVQGEDAMEPTIQRWSAKRKVELLLELIRGEKKLVDVCREHDLRLFEVVLAAHVHELLLGPDQFKQQLHLPLC